VQESFSHFYLPFMYTQIIKMPVQKDSNIVKIAVQMTDQVPQLIEFNQKQPLAGIIQVNKISLVLSSFLSY